MEDDDTARLLATVNELDQKAAELEDAARQMLHDMASIRTAISAVQDELEELYPVAGRLA